MLRSRRSRPGTVALVALLAACSTTPELPPKDGPWDVVLYDPDAGEYPDPGYETIGPVTVERAAGTPRAELLTALRVAAARMGADGVIVQRIRPPAAPDDTTEVERASLVVVVEGMALYYPDESGDSALRRDGARDGTHQGSRGMIKRPYQEGRFVCCDVKREEDAHVHRQS